jgi:hypothetical protein
MNPSSIVVISKLPSFMRWTLMAWLPAIGALPNADGIIAGQMDSAAPEVPANSIRRRMVLTQSDMVSPL